MASDNETGTPWGETFQSRFWWWRNRVAEVTLGELQERVNRHLEPDRQLAVSTLSNYEARGDSPEELRRASEPRASFLAALGQAFPDLNVGWLVTGEGVPTRALEDVSSDHPETADLLLERAGAIARTGGPKVWGVFLEALRRIQYSAPGDPYDLDPETVADLGGALEGLIMVPLARLRAPETVPSYRDYVDYYLSMLTAVMRATPPRGEGRSIEETISRLRGED